MPLDKAGLEAELESIFTDPDSYASAPPSSTASDMAGAWAAAVASYASGVIPASATVGAAETALSAALLSAFGSAAGAAGMESAFTAFGGTVGGGMAPAFTAVPPAGPVGIAALSTTNQDTPADAAQAWADAIDTWMKTGTATPSGGGPPVNWS